MTYFTHANLTMHIESKQYSQILYSLSPTLFVLLNTNWKPSV